MVPSAEGMIEYWLRCDSEQQYAKWMAAFKHAARGKTMADASYPAEVDQIRRLLDMQHPAPALSLQAVPADLVPDEFVAQRFLRKKTQQQIVQKVLEAHANVKELSLTEAKMQYIRAWQSLPEYGIHYFVVRFHNYNSRKPELLSVAYNRLMRMNLDTADSLKT